MRKLMVLFSLMLLAPAASQALTLDDLLVEKGVITKAEAKNAARGGSMLSYNDGMRAEFPDSGFSTTINSVVRSSYTFTDNDDGIENTSSFGVDAARLMVSGTALHDEFAYELMVDFADNEESNGASGAALLDANITWKPCEDGWVKMGQFQVPVSRQFNTQLHKLQFVDRTAVSNFFDQDRQAGLQGSAYFMDGALQLSAGIWNGNSDGEGRNLPGVDTKHSGAVSARYKHGDIDVFSEGDVGMSNDLGASLGATYYFATNESAAGETDLSIINIDAMLKSNGFSVAGEYFFGNEDPQGGGEDTEPTGFYVQAGYMLDSNLEVGARYGYIDCDNGACFRANDARFGAPTVAGDSQTQWGATLNYYWWAHHLKAQLGYDTFYNEPISGDEVKTNRWTLMLTGWF